MIKKYLLLLACTATIFTNSFASENTDSSVLSEKAYVSILTCSSGDEMYAAFGHTAIRICDSVNGIDNAYNYGTFDFNTPNFYIKFAKGTLLYKLEENPYYIFENEYEHENRSVREQKLNLTHDQIVLIYNLLLTNLKPENKYYQYDIFYDNCSTRVRDLVEKILGKQPDYGIPEKSLTFRELLKPFLQYKAWTRFGIDILLGLPIDKTTDNREHCFLPLGLYENIAKIDNPATGTKLVASDNEILARHTYTEQKNLLITPVIFFWSLLILIIIFTTIGIIKKINCTAFDKILFSITGLTGLIVLILMLWSEHASVMRNLNLFWGLPFIIPLYWFTSVKKAKKWQERYYYIITCWSGLFLILFFFLPQEFNTAVFPLCMVLFIRSGRQLIPLNK